MKFFALFLLVSINAFSQDWLLPEESSIARIRNGVYYSNEFPICLIAVEDNFVTYLQNPGTVHPDYGAYSHHCSWANEMFKYKEFKNRRLGNESNRIFRNKFIYQYKYNVLYTFRKICEEVTCLYESSTIKQLGELWDITSTEPL